MVDKFIKNIKFFFGIYQKKFYLLMIFLIISGILEGLSLASIPLLLSALFSTNNNFLIDINSSKFIFFGLDPIITFGLIVILLFLLKNIFLIYIVYFENSTYLKLKKLISSRIFYNLLTQEYLEQTQNKLSKSVRYFQSDIFLSIEYYRLTILIIRESLTLIAIASLLIFASSFYGLFVFLILGSASIFFFRSVKKIVFDNASITLSLREKIIEKIQNTFRGIKEIKVFSLEKIIFNKFINDFSNAEKKIFISDIIFRLPKIFLEVLGILSMVGTLIFFTFKYDSNEIIPIIGLLAISIIRFIPAYSALTSSMTKIKHVKPGHQSILETLSINNSNENFEFEEDKKLNYKKEFYEIEFKDVSFGYASDKKILNNINLILKKERTYFMKGKSGKGKSTLCHLILGLINPSEGQILIDKKNYKNAEIKKLFSYVPQESLIIDDTIENNIVFDQKIDDIAYFNKICLLLGIASFSKGRETLKIGDSGTLLSGGQKQRIAIARSLIRKPKILILDESFNALHEQAEQELIGAIKNLCPDITLIIISHRHGVQKFCDWTINLLDDGKIEETKIDKN